MPRNPSPAAISIAADGSGTAAPMETDADGRAADPARPPSIERSTKISKKLVIGNDTPSLGLDNPSVANATAVAAEVGQPSGWLPLNEPPAQTSSTPVTAPSPATVGEFRPIAALARILAAPNRKTIRIAPQPSSCC